MFADSYPGGAWTSRVTPWLPRYPLFLSSLSMQGVVEAVLCQTPNQNIQIKMVHDQAPGGPQRYRHLIHAVRHMGHPRGSYEEMMKRWDDEKMIEIVIVKAHPTN